MKANDFVSRKHIGISRQEYNRILKTFKRTDYATTKDIDDPKYNWKCIYPTDNDEKYGRMMVSYEQKIIRRLTMGEFYGSGTVD